jgi:hypothetical protein
MAVGSAKVTDMATIMVDTVGPLRRLRWRHGNGSCHIWSCRVAVGPSSVLEDQLLGTYCGRLQNSSAHPAPNGDGHSSVDGGYGLPFIRGNGSAAYGGFGRYDGRDRFSGV